MSQLSWVFRTRVRSLRPSEQRLSLCVWFVSWCLVCLIWCILLWTSDGGYTLSCGFPHWGLASICAKCRNLSPSVNGAERSPVFHAKTGKMYHGPCVLQRFTIFGHQKNPTYIVMSTAVQTSFHPISFWRHAPCHADDQADSKRIHSIDV